MGRRSVLALVCTSISWGCGKDSGAPDARDAIFDGGVDAHGLAACNPVSQLGCMVGEKCTGVRGGGMTFCAPDGDVPAGGACVIPEGGGADDCQAGFVCIETVCIEICSQVPTDSCTMGSCAQFVGLFDDIENVGACLPECNPLVQDCQEGEGCYLLRTGAVCAAVHGEGVAAGQPCEFINDCSPGSGCFGPQGASTCLVYCDFMMHPNESDPSCKPAEVCGGIQDEDVVGVCVEDTSGP